MRVERVRADVEAPLAALGLLVEDITVTPAGRRRVVRIAVDRDLADLTDDDGASPIAPISLDEVADATRVVGAALDEDPHLGDAPYVLEVSSPGVDRPLTQRRHLRRNVGRLARLTLADGSVVAGRIASVSADEVHLLGDPAVGPGARVALADVRTGRVVVEFGRDDPDTGSEPDADGPDLAAPDDEPDEEGGP